MFTVNKSKEYLFN